MGIHNFYWQLLSEREFFGIKQTNWRKGFLKILNKFCNSANYNRVNKTNKFSIFSIQSRYDSTQSKAIDLTEWNDPTQEKKAILLHMVDALSRLNVAAFVPSKNPKDIMNAIFMNWFTKFKPRLLVLGKEYNKDFMLVMNSSFGCIIKSPAAYVPF